MQNYNMEKTAKIKRPHEYSFFSLPKNLETEATLPTRVNILKQAFEYV